MEFLTQQNRRNAGDPIEPEREILATGKDVVILGGGDTGSDCVGTCHRQGARSVTSIELLPRPPDQRSPSTPWPEWPLMYRSSSSHEEGGVREFGLLTRRFLAEGGRVSGLEVIEVRYGEPDASGRPRLVEVPGTERVVPAQLVLLAMGFVHPVHEGLVDELGVEKDARGNVRADLRSFATSEPGVFAAGDCRRGQSLVVWAQWEGREAARAVDLYLMGESRLQSKTAFV